jgi:hypothetical protein
VHLAQLEEPLPRREGLFVEGRRRSVEWERLVRLELRLHARVERSSLLALRFVRGELGRSRLGAFGLRELGFARARVLVLGLGLGLAVWILGLARAFVLGLGFSQPDPHTDVEWLDPDAWSYASWTLGRRCAAARLGLRSGRWTAPAASAGPTGTLTVLLTIRRKFP